MSDLERQLRELLIEKAHIVQDDVVLPGGVLHRARVRRIVTAGVLAAVLVVGSLAGYAGTRDLFAAPNEGPADLPPSLDIDTETDMPDGFVSCEGSDFTFHVLQGDDPLRPDLRPTTEPLLVLAQLLGPDPVDAAIRAALLTMPVGVSASAETVCAEIGTGTGSARGTIEVPGKRRAKD